MKINSTLKIEFMSGKEYESIRKIKIKEMIIKGKEKKNQIKIVLPEFGIDEELKGEGKISMNGKEKKYEIASNKIKINEKETDIGKGVNGKTEVQYVPIKMQDENEELKLTENIITCGQMVEI